MKNSILLLCIVILSVFDYGLIRRRFLVKDSLKALAESVRPQGWKEKLCFFLIPITLCAVAAMLDRFYAAKLLYTIKHITLLAILWPIAITDYKEYRIPNKMILLGLALRTILMIPEMVLYGRDSLAIFLIEIIAAVGAFVVCLICMVIAQGGLGMGDLKLMIIMGLYLGIEGLCYAMFVSLFVSFVIAILLLLTKRKKKTDAIPFAPFILIGTFLSFILSGT